MALSGQKPGDKKDVENLFDAWNASVMAWNDAAVQATRNGIAVWRAMYAGNYKAKEAFEDAAIVSVDAYDRWRKMAGFWVGLGPAPRDPVRATPRPFRVPSDPEEE